ncbi:MAG: FMN-binding protein [Microbacteriaceae bacterium]|nr:FMN-binding protein [Microbacteriaceae bacterium]MCL2796231.1 FMN-binding protein [Microbacteriaceae bacterium]
MTRRWQGTALFAVIMAGISATVAGRLIVGGDSLAAALPQPGTGAGSASGSQGGGADASSGAPSPSPSSAAGGSSAGGGAAASGGTTTVNGDTEQTVYGPVQVAVTFSGSKITGVQTLQAPMGGGRDQMLTQYATPQLAQEVVNSQSARVDTISGATYTSEGYLASVQSAIDKHK